MIVAVVLAAGKSIRMGTQKLLLPFAAQTVIGHVIDQLDSAGVDRVFVVVGVADDGVEKALAGKNVTIVHNRQPDADMLSSVRAGLRTLPPETDAALVVLGDQPSIRPAMVSEMIGAFQTAGRGIVVPAYEGRRGHPLLLAAKYFDEVLSQYDGVGLRDLLHAHTDDVYELAVTERGILDDMDRPADYERELEREKARRQSQP
jgi:molybdenum cofactor cytidylyltransferase